ncbi:MAG: sugar ABC transporter ATP-binding protein [Natronohydrobacter sp.]|nr:sugar ABC transporter ATP-binding protein [Natronohydrobacter sp.]
MTRNALEIRDMNKAFGANSVLRGIDMDLPAGQVTVLMGANGAGKSTLVKIMCGVQGADRGEMRLGGQVYAPDSPHAALRAGIVTVHQSINDGVVTDLDVASNLMLDRIASGSGLFLRGKKLRAEAREIAKAVGLVVPMTQPVALLSLADRQLVAIARALSHNPKVLILDEPTSSLSDAEARRLFTLIESLKSRGVAILYISHRMSDIRRLADRILCMRDGVISGTFTEAPLDYSAAVRAMLGHEMTEVDITIPARGAAVLDLSKLRLRTHSRPFNLTLHANEVVAVVGLVGSGKAQLANVLYGVTPPVAGAMRLDGQDYAPKSPAQAIARKVFMAARDRRSNAVIPDFDIGRNFTLPFTRRHSGFADLISRKREKALAVRMIAEMGVKCQSHADPILSLSGGNQQKVMVGRWMAEEARLLILDEPFQGVDIQARRDIGARIRAQSVGRATLVLVTELDEALEVADRIVVICEGSIRSDRPNRDIDVATIMAEVADSPAEAVTERQTA